MISLTCFPFILLGENKALIIFDASFLCPIWLFPVICSESAMIDVGSIKFHTMKGTILLYCKYGHALIFALKFSCVLYIWGMTSPLLIASFHEQIKVMFMLSINL